MSGIELMSDAKAIALLQMISEIDAHILSIFEDFDRSMKDAIEKAIKKPTEKPEEPEEEHQELEVILDEEV